jgi:hypothetical protein
MPQNDLTVSGFRPRQDAGGEELSPFWFTPHEWGETHDVLDGSEVGRGREHDPTHAAVPRGDAEFDGLGIS